jgi:protein-S-isoprenylcysteine O-methyltransferase Ste14
VEKRLSRWGVGPRTFVPSLVYVAAAWTAALRWPDLFLLRSMPAAAATAGAILTALGVLLWLAGAVTVMRAYKRDELVTTGVFALVRHPVYAGWIALAFPGLALLSRSWPMFLAPLVAWAIFKRLIHLEDEYLERRFGAAYFAYRGRVNEVIPIPRFWRKGG